MCVLHWRASPGELGGACRCFAALHPPHLQSLTVKAAMLSVVWSGEVLVGFWESQRVPELVFRGGIERGVPSRGHSTAVAWDGCDTERLAMTSLAHRCFLVLFGSL